MIEVHDYFSGTTFRQGFQVSHGGWTRYGDTLLDVLIDTEQALRTDLDDV